MYYRYNILEIKCLKGKVEGKGFSADSANIQQLRNDVVAFVRKRRADYVHEGLREGSKEKEGQFSITVLLMISKVPMIEQLQEEDPSKVYWNCLINNNYLEHCNAALDGNSGEAIPVYASGSLTKQLKLLQQEYNLLKQCSNFQVGTFKDYKGRKYAGIIESYGSY